MTGSDRAKGPSKRRSSVVIMLERFKKTALVALVSAVTGAVILVSQFTSALTNIKNFFGWQTSAETLATAKEKIHSTIGDIETTAPAEAQRRLTVVKGI